MKDIIFEKYQKLINSISYREDQQEALSDLLLWENKSKKLKCFYAPFDYVNEQAKIILVGITPGKTQMNRALNAVNSTSDDLSNVMRGIKREGSFSGEPMRKNLIEILNKVGYQKKLGIACSSELWNQHDNLVHFCSLLKYPVFLGGSNYNGNNPKLLDSTPELNQMIREHFVKDLLMISKDAILIPLGSKVTSVCEQLKKENLILQNMVYFKNSPVALPHPSGANQESIALLTIDNYPTKDEYLEKMYAKYLSTPTKNGTEHKTKSEYCKSRVSRWEDILFVRQAYEMA
jgi:hypothetical protein